MLEGVQLGYLDENGEFVPVEAVLLEPVTVYEDADGERYEADEFIEIGELDDGSVIAAVEAEEESDDGEDDMPDMGDM
jgi:hypothetical protein